MEGITMVEMKTKTNIEKKALKDPNTISSIAKVDAVSSRRKTPYRIIAIDIASKINPKNIGPIEIMNLSNPSFSFRLISLCFGFSSSFFCFTLLIISRI